jgi:hypothetical protein
VCALFLDFIPLDYLFILVHIMHTCALYDYLMS